VIDDRGTLSVQSSQGGIPLKLKICVPPSVRELAGVVLVDGGDNLFLYYSLQRGYYSKTKILIQSKINPNIPCFDRVRAYQ
jgi:hypothetical protein